MLGFIYKMIVYIGILAIAAIAATGLAAAVPGFATFPFFVLALLLPVAVFAFLTHRMIFEDTIRRVRNRGFIHVANKIQRNGQSLDNLHAEKVDFHGLNLEGYSMKCADLEKAKMVRTSGLYSDFSKAFLEKARLSLGNFRRARFNKANLKNSRLRYGHFVGADFTGADLRQSNVKGADFSDANFQNAELEGAFLTTKPNGLSQKKRPFEEEPSLCKSIFSI